jgi:hypothetical protein
MKEVTAKAVMYAIAMTLNQYKSTKIGATIKG